MKELYIHIGQQKTGTSALQAFLSMNRSLLIEKGVYYPVGDGEFVIREKNSTMVGNAVGLRKLACPVEQLNEGSIKYILQMVEMFEDHDRVLLSDEVLWNSDPVVYENIRKVLADRLNVKIKIIVYLRRQDERMESRWNQAVKGECYCGTCREFAEKHVHEWDYYLQLKKIEKVVGKGNLIVKVYETECFSDGISIFKDFLSVFNIQDVSGFKIPEYQVNPSLRKEMAVIRQIMNTIPSSMILDDEFRKIFKEDRAFHKIAESVTKAPSFLTYSERMSILDRCRECNIKLGAEYFGMEDSPFQIPKNNDEIIAGGGTIHKDIIYFFGKLLVEQAKEMEMLHWKTDEFILPETVRAGSRVIVYGADKKGCRIYHWLKRKKKYKIVGLVDKRWKKIKEFEKECADPMEIFLKDYDFILISVAPQDTMKKIGEWLRMHGVDEKKIVEMS